VRGERNDGNIRQRGIAADPAQRIGPRHHWHPKVQQNQLRPMSLRGPDSFRAVARTDDAVAAVIEVLTVDGERIFLVIDQQNHGTVWSVAPRPRGSFEQMLSVVRGIGGHSRLTKSGGSRPPRCVSCLLRRGRRERRPGL
jgi:hypothetical protein